MVRRRLLGAAAAVLALTGCTRAASAPPASTSARGGSSESSSSDPRSPTPVPAPSCPTPPVAAVAPTDFPHPELTRHPATTARSADDDTLARQGLAALAAFGGPVATSAFQHYLDASGTFLALPVDGLLTADPALVTELDGVLVRAAAAAVTRAAASTPACTSIAFTSGWRPHDDVADRDWLYTLGRFSVEVLGTVTHEAAGTSLRVTYRAAIGDTYDFDPGSTFARFGQLALDGHAADFLDGGLTAVRTATVTAVAELASPGFG